METFLRTRAERDKVRSPRYCTEDAPKSSRWGRATAVGLDVVRE